MFCLKCKKTKLVVKEIPTEGFDSVTICDGCGRQIESRFCDKYFSCNKCQKFHLCEFCRFCENNHAMQKVAWLKFLNPGYTNNKYSCNFCHATKTATDDGIWHCAKCNHDFCPTC